ncbi:sigma-54-dependent Fis family transcriptional regulator [Paludibacter sp. 221]|uniref:sigma-54 interaction domain-containing protein n=1 Tax=Paludibacter sp. 221 TaxID=2302939 RepID=UPI0013CFC645|nr:sigma-54 dependent transcriptional regulator [Paludibacter sp. 221]NDV45769.1 sigma-54-dependent Fis family transcriptional regulator [Paludibacter sp. 221]
MQPAEIQAVKQRFGIIGNSEALNRAIDIAVQVAPTDLSVLITGESGVGKESFPQIIHYYSHRKHGPYIAVNCGAIPEGTIDSELFGHEKGSFTGATADRKGYFEVADGGTIFLDEVGELPLSTQVRLLRVLETGEFIKVGSSKTLKTNVRVVAATNLNMSQAIRDGRFREDLYYRLNTVPINIPPLRERKEDIVLLFRKFAADFAEKYNMPAVRLTEGAKALLSNYYWNGNVRQLKNITEQISVIEQKREIDEQTLRVYLPKDDVERLPALLSSQHDEKTFNNEREILYQVLFDMKKDMNDLKALVHDIMGGQHVEVKHDEIHYPSAILNRDDNAIITPRKTVEFVTEKQPVVDVNTYANDVETYHDDVEYQEVEEQQKPMSLQDMERQMIIKTLEKYKGRRKAAAEELQISERTLYRKIKEYGIE